MGNDIDLRVYPRVKTGTAVTFAALPVDRKSRRYLETVAGNVSLGGMFLASRYTFRPGTLLQLEFSIPDADAGGPVRARAIVRWRRWWRQPRGMGVQFVEFEGLGRQHLTEWLDRLLPASST